MYINVYAYNLVVLTFLTMRLGTLVHNTTLMSKTSVNNNKHFDHSCPNETVIFTCFGRQAMNMEWIMEPYYVLEEDAKSFVAALAVNNRHIFTFTFTDFISSKLTNLTGYENRKADMTVTLTIQ